MPKPVIIEINKTKIALYPIKGIRTVVLNVMMKGGSWHEKGPNWGAFHLLEHLLFEGTQKFKTHQDFEIYKQDYGISNNAWTGGRTTGFWFQFPDISIKEGLNLFNEVVFNPLIPEEKISKEISVVAQEYKDRWDSPMARFDQIQIENLIGKNHPFGRDGLGQPDYLKTLKREDLLEIKTQYYQPQNMSISIAGNFDVDTVKKELSLILNQYPNGDKVETDWSLIDPQKKYLGYQDDVNQSYLIINWFLSIGKSYDLKTRYGINMLSYMLGGGPNSILFKKIRQELGLVYSIKSRFWTLPKTSAFEIWASVDNKNLTVLTENIKNIVYDFLNNPIDEKEYERAHHYMDLQTLMSYDSIYNIGKNMVEDLFHHQKVYTPEDKIKIAKSIDPEKIRLLLKEKLVWNDAFISVMSPNTQT